MNAPAVDSTKTPPTDAVEPILYTKGLRVNYGESLILRGIDFAVRPGEITVVMGRNGVGKTTLLKSLMGLLKPADGSIHFDGEDITKLSPDKRARRGLGYVPQGRDVFPKLTVYENLEMGLEARRDGVKKVPENELYELFPILGKMDRRMGGNLSGGQQQQLSIARALAGKPRVLILDEPTEGLQPSIILDIERVLIKLKQRGDLAIVLVEQYLEFAQQVADHFYIMDRGSIVMTGTRDDLTHDHISKYLTF